MNISGSFDCYRQKKVAIGHSVCVGYGFVNQWWVSQTMDWTTGTKMNWSFWLGGTWLVCSSIPCCVFSIICHLWLVGKCIFTSIDITSVHHSPHPSTCICDPCGSEGVWSSTIQGHQRLVWHLPSAQVGPDLARISSSLEDSWVRVRFPLRPFCFNVYHYHYDCIDWPILGRYETLWSTDQQPLGRLLTGWWFRIISYFSNITKSLVGWLIFFMGQVTQAPTS